MDALERLAQAIMERNAVERRIAGIIGRPGLVGHVGEYIASEVFHITLEDSATQKGIDGRFASGPLRDKSVNIKWYAKREGLLDINPDHLPDFFLVLAGPKTAAASSRGTARPWRVSSVFLFDSHELIEALHRRGVKIGIATSVANHLWEEAQIYPEGPSNILPLSQEQRGKLALFDMANTDATSAR